MGPGWTADYDWWGRGGALFGAMQSMGFSTMKTPFVHGLSHAVIGPACPSTEDDAIFANPPDGWMDCRWSFVGGWNAPRVASADNDCRTPRE